MTERKEKHKQKFKERGITLIALVITIIVLLILAGVALSALTGDSGILNNAEKAKEKTGIANEKEIVGLAVSAAQFKSTNRKITTKNIQEALDELLKREKAISIDNGDTIVVKFEKSERYYKINENGNIEIFTPYFDKTPGKLAENSDGKLMIESIEDLVVFSAMVNGGYSDENITIEHKNDPDVVLMCDLDFKSQLSYDNSETTIYNGYLGIEDKSVTLIEALTNIEKYKGFIPIGRKLNSDDWSEAFRGTFDGNNGKNNCAIKNLSENLETPGGLFGVMSLATIKNVTITGNINTTNKAGGIVGQIDTWTDYGKKNEIINCINYAQISSIDAVGGIAGYCNGSRVDIKYCVNAGEVIGKYSRRNIGWT